MPVIDASALVAYLAGGEFADDVRSRLLTAPDGLWAPHLIDAEVGHVLRRGVLAGELSAGTAREALEDLAGLALQRAGHTALLDRAWVLHRNVSFCDGLYVALAERLGLPLLTLDARLARAPGIRATIDVVG